MSKKDKLKKDDVRNAAEAESKEKGGKGAKFEVMTGKCQRDEADGKTLRLTVYGRASKKTVDCLEHLLVRGP